MIRNQGGIWIVHAYGLPSHSTPGVGIAGDAANITANIHIDGGAANAVDDTNPTEIAGGYYYFNITATESNGDNLLLLPSSTTADVKVVGVPAVLLPTQGVIYGEASGTPTVNSMNTTLTGIADDELIRRSVVFLPGGTAYPQAVRCSDYANTNGVVTFQDALTTAPVAGDPFVVL